MFKTKQNLGIGSILRMVCLFGLLIGLFAVSGLAQTNKLPAMQDYRGVAIGMTADEVRGKLGSAKTEDKDGFFYVFSDTETAQIMMDADQKVRVISIDFMSDHKNPPSFNDVFGADEKAEPKPDGGIYKMIRYPDAGMWVAYSRLGGDQPVISITINKM